MSKHNKKDKGKSMGKENKTKIFSAEQTKSHKHTIDTFADMPFHMAIIDIDGLHNTNRIHGYHAGDQLIRTVAFELREKFAFNQIYRISGDEFIAIARASTIEYKDFKEKVREIENVTSEYGESTGYTSPAHMFKTIDKRLSARKAKKKAEKNSQERL